MGRAALLAIAVVLGLASSAFAAPCRAVVPHADTVQGPSPPNDAVIHIDDADVEHYTTIVSVTGSFDHAARVTLMDFSGHGLPTETVLVEPNQGFCELASGYDGIVLVSLEALDADGHAGSSRTMSATAYAWQPFMRSDHLLAIALKFFFVGLAAIITLLAVLHRIHRGTNGEPPRIISPVLAEVLARRARARDGLLALAVLLVDLAIYMRWGNWALAGSLWFGLRLGDYWVASRTVVLLGRPRAIAELYGTNLVVRADDHTSSVLLSRLEIKRAQRHAIPRAAVQ